MPVVWGGSGVSVIVEVEVGVLELELDKDDEDEVEVVDTVEDRAIEVVSKESERGGGSVVVTGVGATVWGGYGHQLKLELVSKTADAGANCRSCINRSACGYEAKEEVGGESDTEADANGQFATLTSPKTSNAMSACTCVRILISVVAV